MSPGSTSLLSTGAGPWDPAIKIAPAECGFGVVSLYFDPRTPVRVRPIIQADAAVLVKAAAGHLADLGVIGPRRVDLFFLARSRIRVGVRGFCETDDEDVRAFRIELSGASAAAGLPLLRLLLAHELGHVVSGCIDAQLGQARPYGGVGTVAALLVDEYLAERTMGDLLRPHLVASETNPVPAELLSQIGARNVEIYARPLRRWYRPLPARIRAAYRDEPGPRSLVPTMLEIKRLASPIAYATGSAHAFGVSPAPLSAALAALPHDVAAVLEHLAGDLDAAGAKLGHQPSLPELAAFRAQVDPTVEEAIGRLSRLLLARVAGRTPPAEMHPGWLIQAS